MQLFVLVALLSSVIPLGHAVIPNAMLRRKPGIPRIPVPERVGTTSPNGTALLPITIAHYFDQLIDHNHPELGTFKQRCWFNWEFYEPGGPAILMTPGEVNADGYQGYLTNATINGQIAQQHHGVTILLEHRFFGYSNPYDNLTSQSLELLTVEQAIEDLDYFVKNVAIPSNWEDKVNLGDAPWILVGGSYAGALTSWTMVNKPGVFRAGYASSAVVEAIVDFYGYFTPIHDYMPHNCSSDVEAVIAYLNQIFADNNSEAIQTLKEAFGLGGLAHVDDFAAALQYNLFEWQALQPTSGPGAMFYQFCDALEVKDGMSASASGWGLEHAIQSWGSFWNDTYYAYVCGTADGETCLGTYDESRSYWTDVMVNNANRSWFWMVCNQLGFFQVGPPEDSGSEVRRPAIVSRILQPIFSERQCMYMFPDKFSSPPSPPAEDVNGKYTGWDVDVERLFFANGLRDPWREATVSAISRPNNGMMTQDIGRSDGFHCSDLLTENGVADETVYAVQQAALERIKEWLA